ncbi:MAG: pilus assembly PilX N-terminal domain-containing protein [Candidatus Omnitrophota bacterium]|nr:MAG: pilus assembly PilX N-terminal domain-containing protein [Candidatus Omnitrophota bacterium]
MKKSFALIVTLIVITLLSGLGLFGVSMLSTDTHIAVDATQADEAFYIAEAGLKHVMAKIVTDGSYRDNPTQVMENFASGLFIVDVTKVGNTYTLTSNSTIGGITRVISQSVVFSDDHSGPFANAIYAYGNRLDVRDTAGVVNGNLKCEGEVQYWDPALLTVNGTVEEYVENQTPFTVDYVGFQSRADHFEGGNYTFSAGTYGLEGGEEIWYIQGKVTIKDDVTIYGSIIAPNMTVDMDMADNLTIAPATGEPAIITGNYINADGMTNTTISGLIYSGKDIRMSSFDGLTINGTMISENVIVMEHGRDFELNYDPDALGDLEYFEGYEGGASVIPQNDWNET